MNNIPKPAPKPKPKPIIEQFEEIAQQPPQQYEEPTSWSQVVSTGSTLLDLAISGTVIKGGGLPGGKFVEIFGDSGLGKTTLAGEIAGSCQRAGGEAIFDDPEHRLEPGYCKLMGIRYDQDRFNYPDTITELEEEIIGPVVVKNNKESRDHDKAWCPNSSKINVRCVDSLSALCSRMEKDSVDKRGQKRAKDFHQMFRLITRHLPRHNILMVATNQIIDNIEAGIFGPKTTTSGGHAPKFYASVRIELRPRGTVKSGEVIIGKKVEAFVVKSSIDIEWRTAPIYLIQGYGIDDIRANLLWLKEHGLMDLHPTDAKKKPGYVVDGKNFLGIENAIRHVEQEDLEASIKQAVIEAWMNVEMESRPVRKPKVR